MNRDYCIIRASPLPPAEGCSLPLSTQVFQLRSDIYSLFGKTQGIAGRDQMSPCSEQLAALPLRTENDFFFFFRGNNFLNKHMGKFKGRKELFARIYLHAEKPPSRRWDGGSPFGGDARRGCGEEWDRGSAGCRLL